MKTLLALVACVASTVAMAAEPARVAEARAMMKAMQIEKQMDGMINAMSAGMARQMSELGGGQDPRLARISMEESMAMMRDRALRPGGLLDAMSEAYAEEFSIEELRQIRKFHESPVGRHVLASAPQIMQRVMERSPIITRDAALQVCERVKARLARENVPGGEAMKCAEALK
jgi:hypothetical protein